MSLSYQCKSYDAYLLFFHQIHQPVKVCVGGAAGFVHVHGKAPFRRPDGVFRQPPVFGFDADRVKAWVVQNLVRGFPANAVVNLFCLCKEYSLLQSFELLTYS